MKLYSSSFAPNPRRVGMFIAEKGITGIDVAHIDLGANEHKREGRTDEALQLFQRAVDIRPEYAKARTNYGSLLLQLGRLGDAKRRFEHAAATFPNHPLAMAGLWEDEKDPETGTTERCHVVCTIEPNALMKAIHDRQPLILTSQEQVDRWLNPASEMVEVVALIQTTPSDLMHAWKVSQAVGSVRNNGPELAQPV